MRETFDEPRAEFENIFQKNRTDALLKEKSLFDSLQGWPKQIAKSLMLVSAFIAAAPPEVFAHSPKKIESKAETKPTHEERGPYHFSDDHNWAIYGWGKDIQEGKLPASGNTIIHIDSHSDLGYGRPTRMTKEFLWFWNNKNATKEQKIKALEKESENISKENFIVDALALGMSQEVFWVRPKWDKLAKDKHYRINQEELGNKIFSKLEEVSDINATSNEKLITVHEIHADGIQSAAEDAKSIIMDIDLDYVGTSGQGAQEFVDVKDLEGLNIPYDKSTEKDGKVRNPVTDVHHSTDEEVIQEIIELKQAVAGISGKPISRTVALESDYLFKDQIQLIEKTFFENDL
ncbi:MAG: UPF0489 family protein [bacterium]